MQSTLILADGPARDVPRQSVRHGADRSGLFDDPRDLGDMAAGFKPTRMQIRVLAPVQ
ncbi:hypothetical protein [Burkholderia gladioli]|uniref:hypothetical protein n=1 Tax=Burkholderia gladioli TaxID=28095 RepID=UPI00164152EF|nr:hypothetical protein [Burkholderia gladioli]